MKYPKSMDKECIPLCDALNALPGIETFESCCGHLKRPFVVFFTAQKIEDLRPILIALVFESAWDMNVAWASSSDGVFFWLTGPAGVADGPSGADSLARIIAAVAEEGDSSKPALSEG